MSETGNDPLSEVELVERWNAMHPAGTPVVVVLDSSERRQTVTRSVAWMVSDHASVLLEGISGSYALHRVTATSEAS